MKINKILSIVCMGLLGVGLTSCNLLDTTGTDKENLTYNGNQLYNRDEIKANIVKTVSGRKIKIEDCEYAEEFLIADDNRVYVGMKQGESKIMYYLYSESFARENAAYTEEEKKEILANMTKVDFFKDYKNYFFQDYSLNHASVWKEEYDQKGLSNQKYIDFFFESLENKIALKDTNSYAVFDEFTNGYIKGIGDYYQYNDKEYKSWVLADKYFYTELPGFRDIYVANNDVPLYPIGFDTGVRYFNPVVFASSNEENTGYFIDRSKNNFELKYTTKDKAPNVLSLAKDYAKEYVKKIPSNFFESKDVPYDYDHDYEHRMMGWENNDLNNNDISTDFQTYWAFDEIYFLFGERADNLYTVDKNGVKGFTYPDGPISPGTPRIEEDYDNKEFGINLSQVSYRPTTKTDYYFSYRPCKNVGWSEKVSDYKNQFLDTPTIEKIFTPSFKSLDDFWYQAPKYTTGTNITPMSKTRIPYSVPPFVEKYFRNKIKEA